MATFDISQTYLLTNAYTGPSKQLATTSGVIPLMSGALNSTDAQWIFTSSPQSGFYYLHTKSKGGDTSLDVVNDNDTNSINVAFTATGYYSGQFWRFDPWGDGSYRISNNFTGLDKHLDVYADTLQPYLASGERTGQHWTVGSYVPASRTSSSITSTTASSIQSGIPTSSSTSGSVSSSTATSSANSNSSESSISSGAIGGIAAATVILIVALYFAIMFTIRRRRRQRALLANSQIEQNSYKDRPGHISEMAAQPVEKSAMVGVNELPGKWEGTEMSPHPEPVELDGRDRR